MSVGEVCISVIDMSILASMIIVIVLVLRLLFKGAPGKSAEPCSGQLSYRKFQRKTLC